MTMALENSGSALIVMGVCGVGKSALASLIADRIGFTFVEADTFHSEKARSMMSRGEPLSDAERLPWLDRVGAAANAELSHTRGGVVACSALRRIYRDRLREFLPAAAFIQLCGDRDLIAKRLDMRRDHFVGRALLDSQLAILEPLAADEAGMVLDVAEPLSTLADEVLHELGKANRVFLNTSPVRVGVEDR